MSFTFLTFALPYIIIDRLSGFHKNESSWSQRAWMMAWLAADQFACLITLAYSVPDEDQDDTDSERVRERGVPSGRIARKLPRPWDPALRQEESRARFVTQVGLMAAAVGGFVTVVQLYLQDHDYGAGLPLCD